MPVALLGLLRAYWKPLSALLVFAGLVTALMLSRASTARFRALYGQSEAQRAADAASYRSAQAEAARIATKAKADQEAAYAQAQEESAHAYQTQLADARALARRYAGLHPAPGADPGRAGATDLSRPAQAAGRPAGSGATPVMVTADDLDACTVNTVRAQQWKEWWERVSK